MPEVEATRGRRSLLGHLLDGPIGTALLTALFVTSAVVSIVIGRFLSASQLWAAHLSAGFLAHPIETAFLPGASPLSALVFSPFAGSLDTLGLAHVLFAALAIPLVAERARTLRVPHPNLAALFVAASPTVLAAAPSGLAGADAVVLVALALWLVDRADKPVAAGITLGLLSLLRPELMLLALGVAWARRDRSLGVLACAIPLVYLGAGAGVRGDLGFVLAALSTPALHGPTPGSIGGDWLLAILAACPAVGLVFLLGKTDGQAIEGGDARERREGVAGAAFAAAVLLLGSLDVHHLGLAPERLVAALPLVAPTLARAAVHIRDEALAPRIVVILVVALLGALALNLTTGVTFPFAIVAAWGAVIAVGRLRAGAAIPALALACLVGGPWGVRASRLAAEDQTVGLHGIMIWLRTDPTALEGRTLITDIALLDHAFGNDARTTRFTWPERYAEPLGLTRQTQTSLEWVVHGHPFGEPFLDAGPGSAAFELGDLVIFEDRAHHAPFGPSPRFRIVTGGDVPVYERVLDEGGSR